MSKALAHKAKPMRSERSVLRGRMHSFIMFLPNMVMLLGRLLKDVRVPVAEKALFAAAIIYVISPIDLIPDIFPFIGQVDDLYMVALVLLRLVNRTDAQVVREHWTGGGDIVALADSIAGIAPNFLPKRVSHVLTAKVELGDAGEMIGKMAKRGDAVVREVPEDDMPLETRSVLPN